MKQIQVRVDVYLYSVPFPQWVPLSDTVRLTGRCRRISTQVEPEKEVEFISYNWLGRKRTTRLWMEPDDFRTIEYFQCDEAT